jgi:NAD(P)-dependent dehydrogenase (short-subunit alcohol dehydrogenase family)
MTKSAALEAAASGVRVNALAPGPIETGMLNRFTGTAEAKAAAAVLQALGLEKVDVLGFSLGGLVAQQLTGGDGNLDSRSTGDLWKDVQRSG